MNDTAHKHQLKIARATLRMSDAMVGVMGGMSREEAQKIVDVHEQAQRKKRNAAARARHEGDKCPKR